MLASVQGFTVEQAAAKSGLSVRTVYRRRAEPAFQQQVLQARAEMVERQAGLLTTLGFGAIKVLGEALQDAAVPIAERWRMAIQVLGQGPKFRGETDLEQRLSAVEEVLGLEARGSRRGPSRGSRAARRGGVQPECDRGAGRRPFSGGGGS